MPAKLFTEDNATYNFFPVPKHKIQLAVKAAHNAHIALSPSAEDTLPFIEIFLGGWENSKSAIRFNKEKPDKSEAATPGLVDGAEYRTFILTWTDAGNIAVFMEGAGEPFLSWNNDQPFPIRYFGLRTAWGATGEWKIDGAREVQTPDSNEYQWFPVHGAQLDFSVQAKNDAHVAFTGGAEAANPMYEIFLGGWDNTKCAIRYNQEKPDVATAEGSLSQDNFLKFWARLSHGAVQVGRDGEAEPFLTWTNPEPVVISHFGIRTSWGATGNWILDDVQGNEVDNRDKREATGDVQWVAATGGQFPEGALVGGEDNGSPLYIARAVHEDATLPGKLLPAHGVAYVPWGGAEHGKDSYEVLVISPDAVSWVAGSGDAIPPNSVQGGAAEDGEVLYVGRVTHEGFPTVGKFHPSHGKVYISFGGEEIGYEEFEVLVKN